MRTMTTEQSLLAFLLYQASNPTEILEFNRCQFGVNNSFYQGIMYFFQRKLSRVLKGEVDVFGVHFANPLCVHSVKIAIRCAYLTFHHHVDCETFELTSFLLLT
eukprot:988399_1